MKNKCILILTATIICAQWTKTSVFKLIAIPVFTVAYTADLIVDWVANDASRDVKTAALVTANLALSGNKNYPFDLNKRHLGQSQSQLEERWIRSRFKQERGHDPFPTTQEKEEAQRILEKRQAFWGPHPDA